MTSYIHNMRERTTEGFDELFADVSNVSVLDFPDHANVGDSAIAMGQLAYFDRAEIEVAEIFCIGTLPADLNFKAHTVALTGGGNIAGHYEKIDAHRYQVAAGLTAERRLIQLPQSSHFTSAEAESRFAREFVSRRELVFAGRDRQAVADYNRLRGSEEAFLVPDAVHLLGELNGPAPTRRTLTLARRDMETAGHDTDDASVDWPGEDPLRAISTRIRWRAGSLGSRSRLLNPTVDGWRRLADRRLRRGINLLSGGETIVTDRLHAMLIGLQLGRSVVAVDNSNQKLTKYADAWFGSTQPPLRFARSFDDAARLAVG